HYREVQKTHWLPSDITIRFKGKVLGFEFAGYYTGLYSNYRPNPVFPKNFFKDEILRIEPSVNTYDDVWWNESRPVPLTEEEEQNYADKEDVLRKTESKAYRDSLKKEANRFKPVRYALVGQRIENIENNSYWFIYPLHNTVFYNIVEGWGARLRA